MSALVLHRDQGTYKANNSKKPFCFIKTNKQYLHCIHLLGNTPQVILGSHWPRYPISEFGPGLMWWSIQFDRVVRNESLYICYTLQPWKMSMNLESNFRGYYGGSEPPSQNVFKLCKMLLLIMLITIR